MRFHYIKYTYGGLLCEFGYLNLTSLSKLVLTNKEKGKKLDRHANMVINLTQLFIMLLDSRIRILQS